MQLQERPHRSIGGLGAAVSFAPAPVVGDEPQKGRLVDIAPIPFCPKRGDRLRRARQRSRGVIAGRAGRSEPVAGHDAEVASAPARVRPPELAMRIRRLARRDRAACPAARVHRHDLDRVEIIRGEAELATKKPERAAGHVPPHADPRILAQRYHDAPALEQRTQRFAHRRSCLDRHRAELRVPVHALHGCDVDDHPHLGI